DWEGVRDGGGGECPRRHGDGGRIVFADIARDRAAATAYLAQVARVRGVDSVEPLLVSPGGTVAIAPITIASGTGTHPKQTASDIKDLARSFERDGMQVEFAGNWFQEGGLPATESFGVLAAIVVLLIAFGSVIAMGLPITTALIGVAISVAGVGIIANVFTTPDFAAQVATMIG